MSAEGHTAVMIIAKQRFRDEELAEPKAILEAAGVSVAVASSGLGEAVGKLGKVRQEPDTTLVDLDVDAYDAVIFVGGPGASEYFDSPAAHELARQAVRGGKLLAAICIAPVILARAGLLEGKTVTVFPDGAEECRGAGATVTGNPVEIDGRLITGNGPEAAKAFGEAIVAALDG